ncbi:AAA family ATPase [Rubrobacter calidifluminis]|uniref:AAA family ATPase n=1 Tax=Rubrobacter calidifluminis TaxID=1392640 RepID=UPI0023623132|nr:AAA family ATPase [Rubrobacter calidifluminis]
MSARTLAVARRYLERGFAVVPIPAGEKAPRIPGWQELRLKPEDLPKHFSNGANIGLLLGKASNGLADIDLDAEKVLKIAPRFLPPTLTSGRDSRPHSHWWYCSPGAASRDWKAPDGAKLVELRSTGRQTVVPPSVHPSGERYVWHGGELQEIGAEELHRRCRELATAALIARHVPPHRDAGGGGRHEFALALAGFLLRPGRLDAELVEKLLLAAWDAAGFPDERARREAHGDIQRIVSDTARKIAAGDPATGGPALEEMAPGLVHTLRSWWVWTRSDARERGTGKTACVTPLDAVEPEEVSWLWPGRIPLGKITLIDGDPGTGKSAMTTDLAARVTRGRMWPDGAQCPAGGVVLLSAEDGLADTIRPRLDAAGADTSKILALTAVRDERGHERQLAIPEDLDLIEDAVRSVGALLVVIDPLMAYLAGDVNSHRDQDVRRALAPLAHLAERTGAAVVVVRHLNKAQGGNPIYRGGGSIGIVGAARAGMLVAKDPEDERRRVLAPVKSNLAPPAPSLLFSLTQAHKSGAVRVEWHGESNHDAASLLSAPQDPEERSALDEAKELLGELLADGEVEASAVMAEARRAQISERTLKRAKRELGILSERRGDCNKRGGGTWFWKLPAIKSAKPKPWHSKSETDRTDAENSAYSSQKSDLGLRVPTIKGAKPPGTLNQVATNRYETSGEDEDLPCRVHGERQCEDCWRRVWRLVHEGMSEDWAIAEVMQTKEELFS